MITFDGGGVRGVYASELLDRIVTTEPSIIEKTDLFAGTSSGGITALCLAYGMTPAETVEFYKFYSKYIFSAPFWRKVKGVGRLFRARYDNKKLRDVLQSVFGDTTLAQLRKNVLIPSFNLNAVRDNISVWRPKFFHNFPVPESDGQELVYDVGVRTSVAPTYFPSHQSYIDGGVVADNPSMAALARVLDKDGGAQKLEDIRLLSFSTGLNPKYISAPRSDWGIIQWGRHHIIDIAITSGSLGVVDYECSSLLGDHYYRLRPVLPKSVGLDDVRGIPRLIEYAKQVNLTSALSWIREQFL
ncbi:MAG TPA: patatin-like phospholipase family protein [Thermodesulfobacteriota bacterium]|jgi:patatin-like phospholipase/acyl hydrolase